MKTARVLLTSDIHQHIAKWEQLTAIVEEEKPNYVLIAGDLLPKTGGFKGQRDFFPRLRRNLEQMRAAGARVLLMMGNDDFLPLESLLDELARADLCGNLNGQVLREQGLIFCGVAQVRDYPFAYKDWCVADEDHVECLIQYRAKGLTVSADGRWVEIDDLRKHLLSSPSLGQRLKALADQLTTFELARSIWLVHQPPIELGMDIVGDGQQVGSPTLLNWINTRQPLLGVSGHIHESPYQPGGRWISVVGDTVWVQAGQMDTRLHCVTLEISQDCNIRNIRHSIFGPTAIEFERFTPSK
ncbi:MAG: hypothetical protein FJ147_26805 [Deltaproteobacteria bacterium]|nr:hypothetical protein [Deltaproteobacteria bacterium]